MSQSTEDTHKELKRNSQGLFDDLVNRGQILTVPEQTRLASLDMDALFPNIMYRRHAYCIGVYPQHASPEMHALDGEVVTALNSVTGMRDKDLPKVRAELGDRADIIELRAHSGEHYTMKPRDGNSMESGEFEFRATNVERVPGARFFATDIGGYHGILRYCIEEVARMAPEGANACLTGEGFLVTVKDKKTHSPIIADKRIGPIDLKDDMYHVVPVEFYHVDVDRSQRFKNEWEVTARDEEGNATRIVEKVTAVA